MDFFIYAVPIIAFLLFSAIIWLAVRFWGDLLNPVTRRARKQMIRDLQIGRASESRDSEDAESTQEDPFEAALKKLPFVEAVDKAIISSGVSWTLRQHALVTGGIASLVLMLLILAGVGFVPIVVGTAAFASAPSFYFLILAARRAREFENQLPEALDFVARALRSGHALNASFMMVADELPAPIGPEFKRVVDEVSFGVDFQSAMNNMERRIDSRDLSFFVVALLVQRTTGGNLAEVIGTISQTVRERMKFHRKMRVLSAEGRISGIILTALPAAVAGLLYLFNGEYIAILWTTESGRQLLGAALVMLGLGYVWIRQIVSIEV